MPWGKPGFHHLGAPPQGSSSNRPSKPLPRPLPSRPTIPIVSTSRNDLLPTLGTLSPPFSSGPARADRRKMAKIPFLPPQWVVKLSLTYLPHPSIWWALAPIVPLGEHPWRPPFAPCDSLPAGLESKPPETTSLRRNYLDFKLSPCAKPLYPSLGSSTPHRLWTHHLACSTLSCPSPSG
jgi:hypothetical protein